MRPVHHIAAPGPAYQTLVVDRFPLARRALVSLLGTTAVTEVVATASSAESAWALYQELRPQLVVVDCHLLATGDGVALGRRLRAASRPPLVVIYSSSNEPSLMADCLNGAADCFVHRSAEPEQLIDAVRLLAAGHSTWYAGHPDTRTAGPAVHDDTAAQLTSREQDVLGLLLRRYSNEEIAAELHLAHQTVKNYVSAVLQKLEVGSRRELFTRNQSARPVAA